jgi:hypothetical protein
LGSRFIRAWEGYLSVKIGEDCEGIFMDYAMISVKLITGFFGLWFMTKLLGKKEISQLTPFDFVSSLMLTELVAKRFMTSFSPARALTQQKAASFTAAFFLQSFGDSEILIRNDIAICLGCLSNGWRD